MVNSLTVTLSRLVFVDDVLQSFTAVVLLHHICLSNLHSLFTRQCVKWRRELLFLHFFVQNFFGEKNMIAKGMHLDHQTLAVEQDWLQ